MDQILIDEIAIDIVLGLLVAVGKIVYNRIRDRRLANQKSTLKMSSRIPVDQIKDDGHVTVYKPDKAEIDAEVQNAVDRLMPTVAERIMAHARGYSLPQSEPHVANYESINPYHGFTFESGSVSASTPNSSKPATKYEDFIREICGKTDEKMANSIIDGYRVAVGDQPVKVASVVQDVISKARRVSCGSEIDREVLA